MKAALLHQYDETYQGPEFLRIEDLPDPALQDHTDVIVRIGGAGLCRTDLHIIEGLWRSKVTVHLPYVPGHENASWIEEVGPAVSRFKRGDAVIVHPLVTDGLCPACRRGNDMYCENGRFPGIDSNGGFAEYLRVSERNLIPLPEDLEPRKVAPYADAGLTAYHVAKKAIKLLQPGDATVVIGVGGLGHIAIQVLRALGADRIIAVDRSDLALGLARQLGADHVVKGSKTSVAETLELTRGVGARAVIDFVAEGGTMDDGLAMTGRGGYYFVVGYGGTITVPTIDLVVGEKSIIGNLVGTYIELQELMTLALRGKVKLTTREYKLDKINMAIGDLINGRIEGRGVLVP
jgi:NAD+-dependent secondary alcohol dehydrogenase Adh1